MGCLVSRDRGGQQLDSSNPRVFDVANIDDRGQERSAGKLEITDQELVLYYSGREPIRWPVPCLRRYGYNEELFSFESGRRCATGHGIYAFRCVNAEGLFQLLQRSIVRAGQERRNTAAAGEEEEEEGGGGIGENALAGGGASRPETDNHPLLNQDGDDHFPAYINISHLTSSPSSWRQYVNQTAADQRSQFPSGRGHTTPGPNCTRFVTQTSQGSSVHYADLDLDLQRLSEATDNVVDVEDYDEEADVFQPEVSYDDDDNFRSTTYVNIPTGNGSSCSRISRNVRSSAGSSIPSSSSAAVAANPSHCCHAPSSSRLLKGVTYAQLDLDGAAGEGGGGGGPGFTSSSFSSSAVPTSGHSSSSALSTSTIGKTADSPKGKNYAAIDFYRTEALSKMMLMEDNDGEGFRKTRHNSNIEILSRYN